MRNPKIKPSTMNKLTDKLLGACTLVFAASGIFALLALAFINVILAAWLYPDAINSILASLGKPQGALWYYCMLIGFIPVVGRWYITLLVYGLVMLFV